MATQSSQAAVISISLVTFYIIITNGLVLAGLSRPVVTSKALFLEIFVYTLMIPLIGALIRMFNLPMPWAIVKGKRRMASLIIACAFGAIITHFIVKQPPASWLSNGPQQWRNITSGYVVGGLLVPSAEELTFRGFLFSILETRTMLSRLSVIVITAAIFAALHWPFLYGFPILSGGFEMLSALAAGLVFGSLRVWTGSVLPGLGLHIIGNTAGL